MVKFLYVIAIGLLFAAFVGLGFSTFYPEPKSPDLPELLKYPAPIAGQVSESQTIAQKQFDQAQKDWQTNDQIYNRNLSVGLIIAALIILAISLLGLGQLEVIGDGLTLGGVFTLFYGLIRTFMAGDEKIRFIAVSVGLLVLLFLAYWKFIRVKPTQG